MSSWTKPTHHKPHLTASRLHAMQVPPPGASNAQEISDPLGGKRSTSVPLLRAPIPTFSVSTQNVEPLDLGAGTALAPFTLVPTPQQAPIPTATALSTALVPFPGARNALTPSEIARGKSTWFSSVFPTPSAVLTPSAAVAATQGSTAVNSANIASTPSPAGEAKAPRALIPLVPEDGKRNARGLRGPTVYGTGTINSITVDSRYPTHATLATRSSMELLRIDETADLASQKRQLTDWMNCFAKELENTSSTTVTAEFLLSQVKQATAQLPNPNALRLAAVCLLLERMIGVMGRFSPVMNNISEELLNALYLPVGELPSEEYLSDRLVSLGLAPDSGIQRFLCRKPYFEGFRETRSREQELATKVKNCDSLHAKQVRLIETAIRSWQWHVKRAVFLGWRGAVFRDRIQLSSMNGFLTRTKRKDVLQTHFYAWRHVAQQQLAHRTKAQLNDGIDLIIQREALASVKALEAEDQLEEMRLVVKRLKEEKDDLLNKRKYLESSQDVAILKSDEWRTVTVDAVNFVGSIREKLSQVKNVWGSEFSTCGEIAVRVILGWARSIVTLLPGKSKVRVNNFGSDMRDGAVFICILHVVTQGEVSLSTLEHKNPQKRMEIVLDALHALNIHLGLTTSDLLSGSTDYNFLLLYSLWTHYALPPTPSEPLTLERNHRDDLSIVQQYLDTCRSYYPQWLEQRSVLEQYAFFLLVARARGVPAKVLSAQEEKDLHDDLQLLAIKQPSKIPDVFISFPNITTAQRLANEEERSRVNAIIMKHLALLRSTFAFYAAQSLIDWKPKKKKKEGAKPKREKAKANPLGVMDFTAFYRFCVDCKLVAAKIAQAPTETLADKLIIGKKDLKAMAKAQIAKEEADKKAGVDPAATKVATLQFTKSQCHQIFGDIKTRFNPEAASPGGGVTKSAVLDPDSALTPAEWIAACLHMAIHRHGAPIIVTSENPAPGSLALESFILQDVSPNACITQGCAFFSECWADSVQVSLRRKRKTLMSLYQVFAAADGDGTMSFIEFYTLLEQCGILEKYPVLTKKIIREVFVQFGPGGDLGSDRSAVKQPVLDEDGNEIVTTPKDAPLSPSSPLSSPSPPQASAPASPRGAAGVEGGDPAADPFPGLPSDDHELVYGEFEIALLALAVYVFPAPYQDLSQKSEAFIGALTDVAGPIIKREEKRLAEMAIAKQKEEEKREAMLRAEEENERLAQIAFMEEIQRGLQGGGKGGTK